MSDTNTCAGIGAVLIDLNTVIQKIGMSRGWIWKAEREGRFPSGKTLGRTRRWLLSEVDEWIAKL